MRREEWRGAKIRGEDRRAEQKRRERREEKRKNAFVNTSHRHCGRTVRSIGVQCGIRWMDNDAWKILKRAFFNPVPILFRHWVSSKARTLVRRNLYSQGLGRLSEQQIYQKGETDLKALNAHLTQSKFIGGEVLCHADFFARALLRSINNTEMPTRLTKIADKYQALSAYCLRVEKVLS